MAKLARDVVIAHLSRIYADGVFGEGVVVKPDLSCFAKAEGGDFYLSAPGIGKKVLPEPMGLMELDRVIGAVSAFAAGEDIEPRLEDVDDDVIKGTYFILDIENADLKDWRRLMTDKDVPTSRVSDDKAKLVANAVSEAAEAGRQTEITGTTAANLLNAISVVPAEKTQFTVHLNGLYIQIGTRFNHTRTRKYPLPVEIRPDVVFQVDTTYLAAVLKQIPADGAATLSFSAHPEPIVGISLDGYIYAMSSTIPAAARA